MHTAFSLIIFRTAHLSEENVLEDRSISRFSFSTLCLNAKKLFPQEYTRRFQSCAWTKQYFSVRTNNPFVSCITLWFNEPTLYYLTRAKKKFSTLEIWKILYCLNVFKQTWTWAIVISVYWRMFSISVRLNKAVFSLFAFWFRVKLAKGMALSRFDKYLILFELSKYPFESQETWLCPVKMRDTAA